MFQPGLQLPQVTYLWLVSTEGVFINTLVGRLGKSGGGIIFFGSEKGGGVKDK